MENFEQLIQDQIPKLRRYANALTQDMSQADDLVQDCLERAFRQFQQWRQGSNFRAWLFSIMHNVFIDTMRKQQASPNMVLLDTGLHTNKKKPQTQEMKMLFRDLENALLLLTPDQREVLVMVGLEGMGYLEVSEILNIPMGTVMSRLHRAREQLRQLMYSGKNTQNQHKSAA